MVEVLGKSSGGPGARGRVARLIADPPRVAVLALCAVLLGLRRAEALTRPQFWAEDAVFFQQAYVFGWSALLESYAGYLHTLLRLIAQATVYIDPSRAPAIFTASAGLFTLYVASRTLSERCPLPRLGGAFAFAVVLVPGTFEVLLNVVNLQWVLAAALVLLLLSRDPAGAGQWSHDLAAAALLGVTGPFSVILTPLFAWRAWSRRTRASVVLAAVVFASALVQVYFFRTEPKIGGGAPKEMTIAPGLFLPAVGRRVGASIVTGSLLATGPGVMGTVAGLATLAGVAYMAFRPGALRTERSLLGLVFAATLFGALFRTRYSLGVYFGPEGNGRYVYLPQLMAIWLLLLTAGWRDPPGKAAAALLVVAFLANLPGFREPAYADLHWDRYAPRIRAGERVVVPVNPPGWLMPLPARARRPDPPGP